MALANLPVPPTRHAGSGHLKALDGVRGLAILMVICSHAFMANDQAGGAIVRLSSWLIHYGLFGVDLFFVLSGFLITGILFDSLGDFQFFSKFYARRVLRIFPLYYGILAVLLLLTNALHLHWNGNGWLLAAYLQNIKTDPKDFILGPHVALYHFWSLAVEEQFYLVWPAMVFFLRDWRKIFVATLAGSAIALILRLLLLENSASGLAIHVSTLCRADTLLLGGALALLYRSKYWAQVLRFASTGFWVAAAVVIVSILMIGADEGPHSRLATLWVDGLRYSALAIGFASLVACSLRPNSFWQRIFELAPLRFLGKYSYGLYVLHVMVLEAMLLYLRQVIFGLTHSKLLGVALAGVISLGLSVVLAYLSYHLFEKKFLRLKKYFDYQVQPRRSSSAVAVAIET